MNGKHSPAPWRRDWCEIYDSNGRHVVWELGNDDEDDARLITAAPDLLAACKAVNDDDLSDAIAKVTSGYRWHFSSSAMCDEVHGYIFQAVRSLLMPQRAAIAKAEGRS